MRTSQNRSKTPMERVPGVFRTGRQVEQGELDGPWWDPALDVDTEEEFQNTAVFLCFVPVLRAESLNSTGMDLSPLRSLPCRVQPRSCSARVHARASCSLAPPTGRERAAISEVVEQWNAQIGSACSAPGFLDSGLKVITSTRPRPARRNRVALGLDSDSRTSPASTVRCTSA